MNLTNGTSHLTRKEQKRAARAREAAWTELVDALMVRAGQIAQDKRAVLEFAHVNGYEIGVELSVLIPDDPQAPPPAGPQLVTP